MLGKETLRDWPHFDTVSVAGVAEVVNGVVLEAATLGCDGAVSPPVTALIRLIEQLRLFGVELAFPVAALGYTWAGLLWQAGTAEAQRKARRLFVSVTIGLIIVIFAKPLVQFLETTLCGGGA